MKAYCADIHRPMAYNPSVLHETMLIMTCLLHPLCFGSLEDQGISTP